MRFPGSTTTVPEALPPRKHAVTARAALLALGAASIAAGVVAWVFRTPAPTGRILIISQKNRHFAPAALQINRGDTVMIVNDDADLHHHAYVSAAAFRFDSGDQQPGSRTPIVFTARGRFNVLCGIHPKMHLAVTVK